MCFHCYRRTVRVAVVTECQNVLQWLQSYRTRCHAYKSRYRGYTVTERVAVVTEGDAMVTE
jgi:hypothetical protein